MGYRKRKHPVEKMKLILLSLFGGLVLTGIAGQLFSRRVEEETTISPIEERHKTFIKLLKSSENAIRWIGNKTADSLNGIFKNYTSEEVASASLLVKKQKQILSWLRGQIRGRTGQSLGAPHENGQTREETSASEPGDSGESLFIAHRTPDRGFSWGPPERKPDITLPPETYQTNMPFMEVAKKGVHNFFLYLYNTSRTLASKGTILVKKGMAKVFPQNTISLKKLYGFESAENIESSEKAIEGRKNLCNSTLKPICAVDPDKHFTIFPNICKMKQFNFRHGTNFSEFHSKVCMDLFATHSNLFFQSQ